MVEDYQENYITGWIKLHRSIIKHWIFEDSVKFRAWIIILCEVNHTTKKVNLGNKLFDCNIGESLNSLDTWSSLFGKDWNKSKVRRFFKLLKDDKMIDLINEQKTTRLRVCNYSDYQKTRHASDTEVTRERHGSDTHSTPNKNDNNYKNDKNTTTNVEVDFEKIDLWCKEIGNSQIYLEGLYRLHKLYQGSVSELLNKFKEHLKVFPKIHNNLSDFKKHFASWLQLKNNSGELKIYQTQSKGQL